MIVCFVPFAALDDNKRACLILLMSCCKKEQQKGLFHCTHANISEQVDSNYNFIVYFICFAESENR